LANQKPDETAGIGASVVAVIDENTGRFALVLDKTKPEPHYWKFPGGKIDKGDVDPEHPYDDHLAADHAAVREVREETGVAVQVSRLGKIDKKTHVQYLYVGLGDFADLVATGDEGETVKAFSLDQIKGLSNFFPNHLPILGMALNLVGWE
jgi:ADP-ribose pyrophosphatase YjhB (NUDIX family)